MQDADAENLINTELQEAESENWGIFGRDWYWSQSRKIRKGYELSPCKIPAWKQLQQQEKKRRLEESQAVERAIAVAEREAHDLIMAAVSDSGNKTWRRLRLGVPAVGSVGLELGLEPGRSWGWSWGWSAGGGVRWG